MTASQSLARTRNRCQTCVLSSVSEGDRLAGQLVIIFQLATNKARLDGRREMLDEARAACMRHDPGHIAPALTINLKWPGRGGLFLIPATVRRCFRWVIKASCVNSITGTLGELRKAALWLVNGPPMVLF
jgi:hypothetical protein